MRAPHRSAHRTALAPPRCISRRAMKGRATRGTADSRQTSTCVRLTVPAWDTSCGAISPTPYGNRRCPRRASLSTSSIRGTARRRHWRRHLTQQRARLTRLSSGRRSRKGSRHSSWRWLARPRWLSHPIHTLGLQKSPARVRAEPQSARLWWRQPACMLYRVLPAACFLLRVELLRVAGQGRVAGALPACGT